MQFIRTTKATGWKPPIPSNLERFARALLSFTPRANPRYESKLYLVHEWLIEFDEKGLPNREIGLTHNGTPVIVGPNKENYGFWLDTNMTIADFCDAPLSRDDFETAWKEAVEKLKF